MSNHQVLDNITHKDLCIMTEHKPEYGDLASYTNIVISEFRQVQHCYPIFFMKNAKTAEFEAIALFGFSEEENLFLDEQGWQANYIPLSIQRRPFLIGFQENNEQGVMTEEAVVYVDMDSPRVSEQKGEKVFLEQGGQSDFLQKRCAILNEIHQGRQHTAEFIEALLTVNLIESVSIKVELKNGSVHQLNSLYTVNEEAVAQLTGEKLIEFQQKGYLFLLHMVMASTSNLSQLIDKKNQAL